MQWLPNLIAVLVILYCFYTHFYLQKSYEAYTKNVTVAKNP